jgi:hypothetical protein
VSEYHYLPGALVANNDIAVYVIVIILAAYSIGMVYWAKKKDDLNRSATAPKGARRMSMTGRRARPSAINNTLQP